MIGKDTMKFVYVFSAADKEKMLKCGFKLLKEDTANNVYVFASNPNLLFSSNIKAVHTNMLTF